MNNWITLKVQTGIGVDGGQDIDLNLEHVSHVEYRDDGRACVYVTTRPSNQPYWASAL